jgi:hypothetical protein
MYAQGFVFTLFSFSGGVISRLYPRNTTAWANCRMTYAEPGALRGALGTADTSAEVVSRRCIARAVFFSWDFRSGICKGMSLHSSGSIPDGISVRLGGGRQETNRWREEFRLVNATLPPATQPRRRLEEALEKTSFFLRADGYAASSCIYRSFTPSPYPM